MPKRTTKRSATEGTKPYPDFPLWLHSSGHWAKRIGGKVYYFGKDWQDAIEKYLEEYPDLAEGRTPPSRDEAWRLGDLCNEFGASKRRLLKSNELKQETYDDYQRVCKLMVNVLKRDRIVNTLQASDFEKLRAVMAERWGPVKLGNAIQIVRSVFKYGYDAELLDRPVRFGPQFKKPKPRVLRLQKAKRGKRLYTPKEIRRVLWKSDMRLKAMCLLAINGGFGLTDCATLPMDAVDLEGGWIDYYREKTGVERLVPLWPETVKRMRLYLGERPRPKTEADREKFFLMDRGGAYMDHRYISNQFTAVAKEAKVGRTFYDLKRTFQTKGEDTGDRDSVTMIQGHTFRGDDMAAIYRQEFGRQRLRAVVEHVRHWLFRASGASLVR